MPKIVARFLKSIKQIKRLAKFAKMSRPKCNDEIIWSLTPEEPDGVFAGLRVDERSKNVPFRLLRKEDIVNAICRMLNRPYRKFDSDKPERSQQRRLRFKLPIGPKARKKSRKQKRMSVIRKHAKYTAHYLAMGVASSAAGYGIPPGFNPNAFISADQQHEYPETYTLQQLYWMTQHKRDLHALANTSMI
ncbi:uncharacterized protein LOC111254386 [Varroa destructor]|uniref:Uncharacterized protein n=1 Tax=Varroa destructor TaxID=109461 RepID=A0A7M7KRH7_VARDE|nr:uncharacterized protein LOC111254386 [Varroa destructor]XP_022670887.1 uncharacterized protein LOC111254386 [Varroa destructor]XP_022670888.1 uncharacterized protein LOC111254386 [Varroa destructor]XP_022670889.1 uncharacterized protein LOC111254386 [Varroa destructor]XP_022670890.1 uncharacterized protein LOC111254386 [Varroa destructor]XP_022670891.1 uncharacterized protein LOC111254386 [Varroa destructor]